MKDFGYLLVQLALQLPTLVVLIVGGALAASARGRLPRAARRLLVAGLAVLLVVTLISTVWSVTLPWTADGGAQRLGALSMLVGVVHALLFPVGVGLLIAAASAGRRTGSAPGPAVPSAPAAWGPPADPHLSPTGTH
ncbi:hypothetical protein QQG74_26365 [Micromonospora sp. FIMYZ51]|uniref:hypothetical protein n=1 Tax=Micromonospora sp. FIMYZ51 TaxID=3051832 RepID=UPI00311D96CF